MTRYLTIGGQPAIRAHVHVPPVGPWFGDVDLELDQALSGRVALRINDREYSGTLDERRAGTSALQRRVRIVAGAGAWGGPLPARAYHNDARVRALLVAEDAARELGEVLGTFSPAADQVGIDYVRSAGAGARVLEDVIGSVPWWVDFAGVTQVGPRSSTAAVVGTYEVLEYDPRSRLVLLAVDDVAAVGIGSVLSDRLDEPQTVRELDIEVTAEGVRIRAWCGGDALSRGRLASAFRGLVERVLADRLFGLWRYRVVNMSSDRVELQAMTIAAGLPDLVPVSMRPGVAGVHAELTPGAEVLVEFVEGSRTMPVITHFAGKDGVGWTPVNLTLDATTLIKLGAAATAAAARADLTDAAIAALQVAHDTHLHTGVTTGAGSSAVPTVLVGPQTTVAATKVLVQ